MDSTSEIPSGFRGAAARLTTADIARTAAALGIDDRLVETVAYVESSNRGFLDDGRPQLLFEAHQFHKLTGGKWDHSHPDVSVPSWPSPYGAAGAHQYDRMTAAMTLDRDAALQAATWGMFQELGLNFKSVGFATIDEFVAAMCAGEGRQIDIFAAHCLAHNLEGYLQRLDLMGFAAGYNGTGQVNYYAAKLLAALKNGKFPPVLPAPADPMPPALPPVTAPPSDPAPTPPPPPPPLRPGPQGAEDWIAVELRPGQQRVFPGIAGLDEDGETVAIPPDALVSSDETAAAVEMDGPDGEGLYTATISCRGLGQATVAGPGVTFAVTAGSATLQRLVVDPARAFTQKIPGLAVAALMMLAPIGALTPPPVSIPETAMAALPPPIETPAIEPPVIKPVMVAMSEGERLCLSDASQPAFAIWRCLAWTRSQRR